MVDRQNRAGVSFGAAGVANNATLERERKERLRKLAMQSIDLSKDPYFMRNHLGTFECKLCLTVHKTEGNYMAHTQGKRHQKNLARRAARDAREAPASISLEELKSGRAASSNVLGGRTGADRARAQTIKIGRPGYRVIKRRDASTGQRSLTFELDYPEIDAGLQPRHRFMSAFEQRVEPPDKDFQYVIFAAHPYETIAFKVPSLPIDKGEGKVASLWDPSTKRFTLTISFLSAKVDPKARMPVTKRAKVTIDVRA